MALTRKFLTAMGIEEEKIDEIISAHSETVTALKEQRDSYKADAEKLPDVQKQLEKFQKDGKNQFEEKYNSLKDEYDKYKTSVEAEKTTAKKTSALKALLKEINIADKWAGKIVKFTNLDDIELEGDDTIKNCDELKAKYKQDYPECIVTTETQGANTPNPPEGSPQVDYDKLSDEDYYNSVFKKGS